MMAHYNCYDRSILSNSDYLSDLGKHSWMIKYAIFCLFVCLSSINNYFVKIQHYIWLLSSEKTKYFHTIYVPNKSSFLFKFMSCVL